MNWLVAAGVAAAVLALGALVWALRFARRGPMMRSPEEAAAAAVQAMPALAPIDAVVGEDGRAALVQGADGGIVLVSTRGRRPVARAVAWGEVRQDYDGLLVETTDRRLGTVLLAGITVLDVRRLAPPAAAETLGPA